jgi:hypothetical protein
MGTNGTNGAVDRFSNGTGDGTVTVSSRQRNGVLRVKVHAAYEETFGMPGFSSARWTCGAAILLGEDYGAKDRKDAIANIIMDLAHDMRGKVKANVQIARADMFERALEHFKVKLEAEERVKIEVRDKLQLEAASRHTASVPASSNGVAPPADRSAVSDFHGTRVPAVAASNAHFDEFNHAAPPASPPWGGQQQLPALPQPAPAQSAPGLPPLPGTSQQPTQQAAGSPVQWDYRGAPKTGATFAGGMRNQPDDVKARVKRLMMSAHASQPTGGWARPGRDGSPQPVMWKELRDDQVSWLVAALNAPESASHRNGY